MVPTMRLKCTQNRKHISKSVLMTKSVNHQVRFVFNEETLEFLKLVLPTQHLIEHDQVHFLQAIMETHQQSTHVASRRKSCIFVYHAIRSSSPVITQFSLLSRKTSRNSRIINRAISNPFNKRLFHSFWRCMFFVSRPWFLRSRMFSHCHQVNLIED